MTVFQNSWLTYMNVLIKKYQESIFFIFGIYVRIASFKSVMNLKVNFPLFFMSRYYRKFLSFNSYVLYCMYA